jgi:aminoglycoside 6'-N-acetyltransferase I
MAIACSSVDQPGWLALREQLWPRCTRSEHLAEMSRFLASPEGFVQFVEYDQLGNALGFVEASLRYDYVNGTNSSPVVFLEGIYVAAQARRQGVARMLVAHVERWAVGVGCNEFASDALLENTESHDMHTCLGFQESERVVFFKKALR